MERSMGLGWPHPYWRLQRRRQDRCHDVARFQQKLDSQSLHWLRLRQLRMDRRLGLRRPHHRWRLQRRSQNRHRGLAKGKLTRSVIALVEQRAILYALMWLSTLVSLEPETYRADVSPDSELIALLSESAGL